MTILSLLGYCLYKVFHISLKHLADENLHKIRYPWKQKGNMFLLMLCFHLMNVEQCKTIRAIQRSGEGPYKKRHAYVARRCPGVTGSCIQPAVQIKDKCGCTPFTAHSHVYRDGLVALDTFCLHPRQLIHPCMHANAQMCGERCITTVCV